MPVGFDDLSSDVKKAIANLEIEVAELRFASKIYQCTTAVVFVLFVERVWHRFF